MPWWRASSGVARVTARRRQHLAAGERHDAGHHLGQRRLAGAVLAHERMDLAAFEREVDAVDRRHAGVLLGRLAQFEHRVGHAQLHLQQAAAALDTA
jgi:hypothetical protein